MTEGQGSNEAVHQVLDHAFGSQPVDLALRIVDLKAQLQSAQDALEAADRLDGVISRCAAKNIPEVVKEAWREYRTARSSRPGAES